LRGSSRFLLASSSRWLVARKREALLAQWQQGSAAVVEVKRRTQAA
jgi:hypothetical protein